MTGLENNYYDGVGGRPNQNFSTCLCTDKEETHEEWAFLLIKILEHKGLLWIA